jgi:hypothetical protein
VEVSGNIDAGVTYVSNEHGSSAAFFDSGIASGQYGTWTLGTQYDFMTDSLTVRHTGAKRAAYGDRTLRER